MFTNGFLIRFLFIAMIASSRGAEPHCSKFPYEEALLEKMIRMEIEVQQMRGGIHKVKEQVEDELDKLKDTRVEMKKLGEDLSREWTKTKLQLEDNVNQIASNASSGRVEMMNDIKLVQQQNEEKFMRMSEDLVDLRNKTALESHVVPNVQFVARTTRHLSFSKDQTIIFGTILSNEGKNYNERTGVFSAPSSGNYIFTTQFCGQSNNYFEFSFMVNDNEAQRGLINGVVSTACWSSVMTKRLDAGDRVFVKDVAGSNRLESGDQVYRFRAFNDTRSNIVSGGQTYLNHGLMQAVVTIFWLPDDEITLQTYLRKT